MIKRFMFLMEYKERLEIILTLILIIADHYKNKSIKSFIFKRMFSDRARFFVDVHDIFYLVICLLRFNDDLFKHHWLYTFVQGVSIFCQLFVLESVFCLHFINKRLRTKCLLHSWCLSKSHWKTEMLYYYFLQLNCTNFLFSLQELFLWLFELKIATHAFFLFDTLILHFVLDILSINL